VVNVGVIDKVRQEINKKRWERWRANQKTKREKSYCYSWSNWSDVPWTCASDYASIPEGWCIPTADKRGSAVG